MDGIIVLTHYNGLIARGEARAEAMLKTCTTQMRPVVMTCVVAGVGLLPAAFSQGVGSQVQKPLALVVVGGMSLAPILILIILPVLILLFSRRRPAAIPMPAEPGAAAPAGRRCMTGGRAPPPTEPDGRGSRSSAASAGITGDVAEGRRAIVEPVPNDLASGAP